MAELIPLLVLPSILPERLLATSFQQSSSALLVGTLVEVGTQMSTNKDDQDSRGLYQGTPEAAQASVQLRICTGAARKRVLLQKF